MNYWLYTITKKKDSEKAGNLFTKKNASLPEFVGELLFRQFSKLMI